LGLSFLTGDKMVKKLRDDLDKQRLTLKEISIQIKNPYGSLSAICNGYVRKPRKELCLKIDKVLEKPKGWTMAAIMEEVI
jgi:hypothetical protein